MQTSYDVQDAVSRLDTSTDKLNSLSVGVAYNYAIWSGAYFTHNQFMATLASIGDFTSMSHNEVLKYHKIDHLNQINLEIGNFRPHDYVEHAVGTRVIT